MIYVNRRKEDEMSKSKLAAIIIICTIAIVVAIVLFSLKPWEVPPPSETYTLHTIVSPSGAGSVSPSGGEYESGVQVTLTASPASGYTFDYWSGSASGESPTVTITMDSSKSLTANFKTSPQMPQTSRTNPAGLRQTVRVDVDDWLDGKVVMELEMLELISGSTAWNMIHAWNMFNDEPEAGQEYILAKFRVKIVELEEEPYDINHAQFDVYSATGVEYSEFVSVAGMNPDLRTSLYEGAEHIGYTAFLVRTDDSPVAVYMLRWDENAWLDSGA